MDPGADEFQVAVVQASEISVSDLLSRYESDDQSLSTGLAEAQRKDSFISSLFDYLQNKRLSDCSKQAKRVFTLSSYCVVENGILYYVNPKLDDRKKAMFLSSSRSRL